MHTTGCRTRDEGKSDIGGKLCNGRTPPHYSYTYIRNASARCVNIVCLNAFIPRIRQEPRNSAGEASTVTSGIRVRGCLDRCLDQCCRWLAERPQRLEPSSCCRGRSLYEAYTSSHRGRGGARAGRQIFVKASAGRSPKQSRKGEQRKMNGTVCSLKTFSLRVRYSYCTIQHLPSKHLAI